MLRDQLIQAIQAAVQGQPYPHREAQRRLISQGQGKKEIARELHITEGTVKGHVSTILAKL